MTIETIVNEKYNANTYLIKKAIVDKSCYLIDAGNAEGVFAQLDDQDEIAGIFLTHAHYDHICGINEIANTFQNCKIYCSSYTRDALADSKINLSFYHNSPITYVGSNIQIIGDQELIALFDGLMLTSFATPGHNKGSLCFKVGDVMFTGDSLIPQVPLVTKLKGGNKSDAINSVLKIQRYTERKDLIYPGHGKPYNASQVDWKFYTENDRD